MVEGEVKVKNKLGLHVRPASAIVKLLQAKKSAVFFTYNKATINARSIMSLLVLAAGKNAKISIQVSGDDEEETLKELLQAFDDEFQDL